MELATLPNTKSGSRHFVHPNNATTFDPFLPFVLISATYRQRNLPTIDALLSDIRNSS
jgi:hypothetical protein